MGLITRSVIFLRLKLNINRHKQPQLNVIIWVLKDVYGASFSSLVKNESQLQSSTINQPLVMILSRRFIF